MSDRQTFRLVHARARDAACSAIRSAPDGYLVEVKEPTRNAEQNRALHALLADIVKARTLWAGREWDIDSWRAIFASAYARAVNLPVQTIPGLEGEFVALRPSTARMSKSELSALIDYVSAFCVKRNIPLRDTKHAA
ncbi:MAG TPA: recombination protein NinB [Nitrospirota bacterium]